MISFSRIAFVCAFAATLAVARPPAPLPGTEISDDEYFRFSQRPAVKDSAVAQQSDSVNVVTSENDPSEWLAKIEKSWSGLPLASQMAADPSVVKMGMGAIFVPVMSSPELEGEIEIMDTTWAVVASGVAGRKYSLLEGRYFALMGSGSHKQKIVRSVVVREGRVTPVLPDWSGLVVEVVNEKNAPFRGEYELARVDKFESYGRSFGRDPGLGEKLRTWTLKPGTYKIFGSGENYNTRNNYITVRLMPGELTRVVVVEEESSLRITGGGIDDFAAGEKISSHWKYGVDIGGTVDFNYVKNNLLESKADNRLILSLLWGVRLAYKRDPVDWETRLDFNEGISIDSMTLSTLRSSADEARLQSIFTWRLLKRLGPYGRFEGTTGIIPEVVHAPTGTNEINHPFLILSADSTFNYMTRASSFYTQRPFSPVLLETGAGINADLLTTRWIDARLLTGIGLTYERRRDEFVLVTNTAILDSSSKMGAHLAEVQGYADTATVLADNAFQRLEVGPEVLLNTSLRLGRVISSVIEVKYFAPFKRVMFPDVSVRTTVRWRVARLATLDYEFRYTLVQPDDVKGTVDELRHRILARFSFTSR